MSAQKGRDGEEMSERGDAMTEGAAGSAGRAPGTGMAGGNADLTSLSQQSGVGNTGSPVRQADLGSAGQGAGTESWGAGEAGQIDQGTGTGTSVTMGTGDAGGTDRAPAGAGTGTAPAVRSTDIAGGMGSGAGDDDGAGAGGDMDASTQRGDTPSTGSPERAGLGGSSSGQDMNVPPEAGSGMANPADMGDQG